MDNSVEAEQARKISPGEEHRRNRFKHDETKSEPPNGSTTAGGKRESKFGQRRTRDVASTTTKTDGNNTTGIFGAQRGGICDNTNRGTTIQWHTQTQTTRRRSGIGINSTIGERSSKLKEQGARGVASTITTTDGNNTTGIDSAHRGGICDKGDRGTQDHTQTQTTGRWKRRKQSREAEQ